MDGGVQAPLGGRAELVGHAIGAQPRLVQDLVGVDVADPGDHVLVEQQRLEQAVPRAQQPAQHRQRELTGDRVDTEVGQLRQFDGDVVRVEHDDLAERARVDEPQLVRRMLAVRVEVHHDVRVRRPLGAFVGDQHLTAHPQVDHHLVAGVERQAQVLAMAVGGRDRGTGQPVDQRLPRRAPHGALATDLDPVDAPSDGEPVEPAADRLDLGQLGHQLAVRKANAADAAACSADFLERPSPSPTTCLATLTVAWKRLSWSGPVERTE